MNIEQQVAFFKNINEKGFEEAVFELSNGEKTPEVEKLVSDYILARSALFDLISLEVIESLEVETIL